MSRRVRLTVGIVPTVTLYIIAGVTERLFYAADRAFYALRDWMDA